MSIRKCQKQGLQSFFVKYLFRFFFRYSLLLARAVSLQLAQQQINLNKKKKELENNRKCCHMFVKYKTATTNTLPSKKYRF